MSLLRTVYYVITGAEFCLRNTQYSILPSKTSIEGLYYVIELP